MRARRGVAVAGAAGLLGMVLAMTAPAGAATPNDGVTAKVIKVGIPYIDFSSLVAVGVKLNQGNLSDAYNALINNLNQHGGIAGRHLVPFFASVNPTNTASPLTTCTQLTEDNSIFVAMSPYMPDCYLQQHATPTINATFQGTLQGGSAPNFTLAPPASAYDPIQLSVFSKLGMFKNKKVGVFAGSTTDKSELSVVLASLKKLHVNVVQSGVDAAPPSDQVASVQQTGSIALRFQKSGVNEVVAVGAGSSQWPTALLSNQSTYNPNWIATDSTALSGTIGGASGSNQYLKTVVTSSATLSSTQAWNDPLIQACVKIIRKAYPNDTITAPNTSTNSSDHSYVAPEAACQNLSMFEKIAGAAGKNLTVASFTKAGYGLRNVVFPGSGGPVSFGPGRAYAIGPVYIGKYSAAKNQLVFSTKSATS